MPSPVLADASSTAGALTLYVAKVRDGSLSDPALSAQLRAGYEVLAVRQDLMEDSASAGWATLIEYRNPRFDPRKRPHQRPTAERQWSRARVCAVQWRMRDGVDLKAFTETATGMIQMQEDAKRLGKHIASLV